MKKLLMFLCCVFMAGNAFGARTCPGSVVNLQGTQNGNDDEFVFTTRGAYEETRKCNENGKTAGYECHLKNGNLYECDAETGCTKGQYLFGENGFVTTGGKSVANKILMCLTSPDAWYEYTYSDCPGQMDNYSWHKIDFINSPQKECYWSPNGPSKNYCCKKNSGGSSGGSSRGGNSGGSSSSGNPNCPQRPPLLDAETGSVETKVSCYTTYSWPRDLNTNIVTNHVKRGNYCDKKCIDSGWYFTLRSDACEDGYKPDESKTKCIKKEGSSDNGTENSVLKCIASRKTEEGQACCWLKDNVATWNGKNCVCAGGKEFYTIKENGYSKGRCRDKAVTPVPQPGVPEPQPVVPTPKPYTCLDYIENDINVDDHVNCPDAKKAYEDVSKYCTDCTKDKCAEYSAKLAKYKSALEACQSSSGALSIEIEHLSDEIAGKIVGWKDTLSVWKDKQGNFNTARLASDSIAGVVLGTAGGLITSHVVKKSQVKSGFEDINCVIGGQKVADWHDEFTVGIK